MTVAHFGALAFLCIVAARMRAGGEGRTAIGGNRESKKRGQRCCLKILMFIFGHVAV
jgi:hypothetical protein